MLLTVSLASLVLAVAVYSRAPDRVWNRLFAVQAVGVAVWVAVNYMLQTATTVEQADLWLRLTHPAVALVICSCVDLFWVFPERTEPTPLTHRVALYATGAFFSLAALSPHLYRSIRMTHDTVLVDYDWAFLGFGVFCMVTLSYADVVLFRKLPRLTGLQRAQVKYVLAGMVVGQALSLLTMVLLPLIWHNTFYSRWGSAAYICVISPMAYAIAKHGIVRPGVALVRVAAYALTGVTMVALLLALQRVSTVLMQRHGLPLESLYVVGGLAVGLLSVPVHLALRRRMEHAQAGALRAEATHQASDAILRTLDSQELPRSLAGLILQLLQATHVSVYMRAGPRGRFVLAAREIAPRSAGPPPEAGQLMDPDSVLVAMVSLTRDLLDRSQVRRFQSVDQAELILPAMRSFDAEVVAPVLWEDLLMGLVIVGERRAGDMYGPDELQMLRTLLPQISLATRNAELFDGVVQMKEYNENIVRQMQSGVIAVNAEGKIEMFNPAAEETLGLNADEVKGKPLDVLPDKIAARLARALSGVLLRPEDRLEIENSRGEKIPVACSTSRWRGSPLVPEGAVAVISDLTLVEELERERSDAEHLMVIRLLTAGMAHELRNPLVAIRTFAELLPTRWEDDEFRTDFLATAQDEIDRIDRLLSNMLMLSKPADAVVEPIDVDTVCEGVVRAMSAAAGSRQVQLLANLTLPPDRPFFGDRSRLHQALINLVKNAVEAEPVGGMVRVSTDAADTAEGLPGVTITIHNANSYIPEDQQELIFRPFYTQRTGGTGLGLPVCQTIIEEHKGTIRVVSHRGQGTSFIVEFPLTSETGEQAHDRSAQY